MANPSGTVAQTSVDISDILDSAAKKCGIQPAQMTLEVISGLRLNLYLILAGLTNRGIALWAVEKEILPLRADQVAYSIEAGTVAVLNSTYVTPQQLSYTGNPTATFSEATAVAVVGLLPSVSSTPPIPSRNRESRSLF